MRRASLLVRITVLENDSGGVPDPPRKAAVVAANPISLAPDDEFADLLDDFLASQLSPLTRSSYAGDLTIFLTWLAGRDKHPRDVSRPDIDRYRNWLAELIGPDGKPASNGRPRYAPATIARKLSAVRAFYNYLSERRVIPGSPAAGVKGPKLRREPRGRAITDEQVRKLLAVATERGPETEAMICLLLLNGLRVSELCSADVENLHREPGGGHSLVVRGKGGKDVDVALNDRTERAILKTVGARSQGPIFRRQDGRRLRAGNGRPARPLQPPGGLPPARRARGAGRARRRGRRPGRRRQPPPPAPHLRHPPARPRRAARRRPGRRPPRLQRHDADVRPLPRRLARAPDPQARLLTLRG